MAKAERFEDLQAWQTARGLTAAVYEVTRQGEFARDFGLRDQMRRAAVSVMSNIAEGFERTGDAEFLHSLSMAKGSAGEVRAQLYVALDAALVDECTFSRLTSLALETSRLIAGLMRYLSNPPRHGGEDL